MANRKYDSFSSLNASKSDWIVPTRVLNLWRGYRKTGEPFKGFNLLLLDHKVSKNEGILLIYRFFKSLLFLTVINILLQRSRVHAFVPYNLVDEFEPMIQIGNLYVLENFSVKPYTADDKFRCLRKKYQIVFNEETELTHMEENVVNVENCCFDFFDIADLPTLSQQNTYLTGTFNLKYYCSVLRFFTFFIATLQKILKFQIDKHVRCCWNHGGA